MTPDDIRRFLALPEKFRKRPSGEVVIAGAYFNSLNDDSRVEIAIASMIVGLRKGGHMPTLNNVKRSGEDGMITLVACDVIDGDTYIVEPDDFHALLSACEHVSQEEANDA